MTRAVYCDECKHYDPRGLEEGERVVCRKGHKPRFYKAPTTMRAILGDYGWRRRCEDFVRERNESQI